jgi:chaperonin GroES
MPGMSKKKKTSSGLYLPQGVSANETVLSGTVLKTGPGIPLPLAGDSDEPWEDEHQAPRYLPVQVEAGDYALFLKRYAYRIEYDDEPYYIVPQSGILMVIRDNYLV